MSRNTDPQRVVTGTVRLSYVHLLKPRQPRPGSTEEPKFSVTLLIPKSDVATMQRINAAIQAAIQDGVGSKWNGVRPPQPALPLYDGDGVRQNGEPFSAECKGHYVMTASSRQQPEIVNANMEFIINPTEIYSGMYARVSIRFFAYNSNGKKGIGCGLGNVQKVGDGAPLAGGASAADDFGGMPAPAQPVAPIMPQQPAYGQQQPNYGQYQQPSAYPQQPSPQEPPINFFPQPATPAQQQIDPITGKPIVPGGILGINQP